MTSSQKVQRGELRELAKRLPSSPQCHDMRMLKRRQKRIDAAAGQGGVSALGTLTSAAELSAAGELTGAGTLSGAGGLTRSGELAGPDPGALSGIAVTPPPVLKPRTPAAPPTSTPNAAPKGDDDGA